MEKHKNFKQRIQLPFNKRVRFLILILLILTMYALIYSMRYKCDTGTTKMTTLDISSRNGLQFIREKTLVSDMKNTVLPFVDSVAKGSTFKNGKHTIAYNMYLLDSPKANVVISHGFIERKEKYTEAIFYFLNMGYQVFVPDHAGHGASTRACTDSSMVHVESYQDFASDLKTFISGPVKINGKGAKTILYGHSMGGAIAALTVEQNPDLIDGLILNAPMFKIKNPIPEFIGEPVTKIMEATGNGKEYAVGYRKYNSATDNEYDPVSEATFCRERAKYWHEEHLRLTRQPTVGASWGAGANFIDLTHEVLGKGNVEKITIPILIFQAEHDAFVEAEGQYEFANRSDNIEFYFVKNAGHEIYIERNNIIIPYYNKLNEFINKIKI